MGQQQERLDALKKSVSEDPKSLAFVSLAEEHIRLGQLSEAAKVAEKGLVSHPNSVAGRLALAVAEAEQNHIREAIEQIKQALLIDQENPKALALMGRILLKKGMAKRAVQFLSHAVKLDPRTEEYGELLDEARQMIKKSARKLPVFDGNQVPDSASPWSDGSDDVEAEDKHTVFDPDALKRLKKKKKLSSKLKKLPAMNQTADFDEEPTAYLKPRKDQMASRDNGAGPLEEPTAFAGKVDALKKKKSKMGGSAAEFSQMMKKADADAIRSAAEARVKKSHPPSAPPVDDLQLFDKTDRPASAPRAAPRKSTSSERPSRKLSTPAPKAPSQKRSPPSTPRTPPKPPSAPKPAPVARQPAPNKAIGPMATQMVDEALWALLGEPAKPGEAPAAPPPVEPAKPEPGKKKAKPAAKPAPAPEKKGGMVVRTSERFGAWTRYAILLVLSLAALWIGYALAVSRAGPAVEVAEQELIGIASDLETGGLASLLSAEEKIKELRAGNPDLAETLAGAAAEVYARQYVGFGADDAVLKQARAAMQEASQIAPSVEYLAAIVALSTSAKDLKAVSKALDATLAEYPESPKSWVLRAKLAQRADNEREVADALYKAYQLNPQHRLTLLELARWHGHRGAHGTAFNVFDQLQEVYPLDVEAAIDRYVLGQSTGIDPAESKAVANLAGLVRDEIPEVAKDETGRAAMAFAVAKFAAGDVPGGVEELGRAEAAFERSAEFHHHLGAMFLAVGDWERARKHYKLALELEPQASRHRVGLARADLQERSKVAVDLSKFKSKTDKRSEGKLPFGLVKFAFGQFVPVEVELDGGLFPERAYGELVASTMAGPELQRSLEAVGLRSLGDQRLIEGKPKEAIGYLDQAEKLMSSPDSQRSLGRARLALQQYDEAAAILRKLLSESPGDVAGRYLLARTLVAKQQPLEGLKVLEDVQNAAVMSPDALLLLAELRSRRGDDKGALEPLTKALELRAKWAKGWLLDGRVRYQLDEKETALESCKKAIEFAPVLAAGKPAAGMAALHPVGLLCLGRAAALKNERTGTQLLRQALTLETVPDEAHFYLGSLLLKNRRSRREGKQELERYIALVDSGPLFDEAQQLLRRK